MTTQYTASRLSHAAQCISEYLRRIYIACCSKHTRRSDMDHTVLPENYMAVLCGMPTIEYSAKKRF